MQVGGSYKVLDVEEQMTPCLMLWNSAALSVFPLIASTEITTAEDHHGRCAEKRLHSFCCTSAAHTFQTHHRYLNQN